MKQEKLQQEIARRNEIWQNSTKAERAVLVAQDVLDRLNFNQIVATPGQWVDFEDEEKLGEGSLQCDILEGTNCNCCAMGGMMIATIAFRNQVSVSDLDCFASLGIGSEKFDLSESFSEDQLILIEQAFECGNGWYPICFDLDLDSIEVYSSYNNFDNEDLEILERNIETDDDKENLKIIKFYHKYESDEARMRGIMENIIENKGVFVL